MSAATSLPANALKFGTSGLRGLVTELCGPPAYFYAAAFVSSQRDSGALKNADSAVFIGRDLRASSPAIANLCIRAVHDAGFCAVDCGALPTPALALSAMQAGAPSIMVTGSHIPDDRNGLKFYRPDGEIDKADEARINALHANLARAELPSTAQKPAGLPPADPVALYQSRYLDFFPATLLTGMRVGIYQHSSVARDIFSDVLRGLGAHVVALGRAEAFIPVDTEAVRDEDKALARDWSAAHRLDAIVSTDGDADRPLIADETGAFLRGDLVGAMTAAYLGIDSIVTPVTSNSRLETCGFFSRVARTRVGSPFVIAALEMEKKSGNHSVLGFEANGGVLLGCDVQRDGRVLRELATRDALLPVIACLAQARANSQTISQAARAFGLAYADSTRIEHMPSERSAAFLARLGSDKDFRENFFADKGGVQAMNMVDGVQCHLSHGNCVHFRASGNAPEFRIYVEADDATRAADLLVWARAAAQKALNA